MKDDRLDDLLSQARKPDPPDDGFTAGVMARVRAENGSRRGVVVALRKFVARPAVLAAAAVLATGGALAAVRTVVDTPPAPQTTPAIAAPVEVTAAPPRGPVAATPRADVEDRPAAQAAASTRPTTPPEYREAGLEGGYESEHASYAVDRGVRLDLDTHANAAAAGRPLAVTTSLSNTADRPVELWGQKGCLMQIHLRRHSDRESSSESSGAVVCAGSGEPATADGRSGSGEFDRVVLQPGQSRSLDTKIVFPEPGRWFVVASCMCFDGTRAPKPTMEPTRTPSTGLVPQAHTSSESSGESMHTERPDDGTYTAQQRPGDGTGTKDATPRPTAKPADPTPTPPTKTAPPRSPSPDEPSAYRLFTPPITITVS